MANNKIDTGVDKIGLAEGEVNFLKMIIYIFLAERRKTFA